MAVRRWLGTEKKVCEALGKRNIGGPGQPDCRDGESSRRPHVQGLRQRELPVESSDKSVSRLSQAEEAANGNNVRVPIDLQTQKVAVTGN